MQKFVETEHVRQAVAELFGSMRIVVMGIVVVFFAIDIGGSFGHATVRVDGPVWMKVTAGFVLFVFTSVIQFVSSGLAYRSGTMSYIAGIGIFFAPFVKPKSGGVIGWLADEGRKVTTNYGGMGYGLMAFWPSVIFDVVTDASFFLSTPWRAYVFIGALASIFSEQFLYYAQLMNRIAREVSRAEEENRI